MILSKDIFIVMATDPTRRTIDDARALKALAHPLRLDLLEAVSLHGPLTATGAADLVDESPANCSWHLRQLAKYGYIEEVPGATGRERPWRRTGHGMEWHESDSDPAMSAASHLLTEVFVDREVSLIRSARNRPQPEGWTDSPIATQSIAWLTADELADLGDQLVALLATHRGRIDDPAQRPAGARPVRMIALAAPDDRLLATDRTRKGDPHE
jgi:DNA-binding transcriptional ArsR family regulator